MTGYRLLYLSLGVIAVLGIGAVGIYDSGVEFPDGTFQMTAAGFTAASAVQGKTPNLVTVGFSSCSSWTTLYSVPAGKRLVIEWLSVQGGTFQVSPYPMDLYVRTHDGSGQIIHPIVRLSDGVSVGGSFLVTQIWSGPVRLYGEASQPVEARLCIDGELENEPVGSVSFSGYLIDA